VIKIISVLAAAVLLLLAYAATRPGAFSVQRSVQVQAPPAKVLPLISDFHNWPAWSPWEKLDPAMTRTHSGAPSGKGAAYAWQGNKKVGEGRMEITDASPAQVDIKLDFFKPFEAHNTAQFTLQPRDGGTQVTWTMSGAQPYMMKVMTLFCSMDKMVGKDFEAGLANLKAVAEK
jgi:hypothetical protein